MLVTIVASLIMCMVTALQEAEQSRNCDTGQAACQGSNNLLIQGNTVMCCNNYEGMNNFKSIMNGVVLNECKCVRNANNNHNMAIMSSGGITRLMTDSQQQQFQNKIAQFSQNMAGWNAGLTQRLNKMQQDIADFNAKQQSWYQNYNPLSNPSFLNAFNPFFKGSQTADKQFELEKRKGSESKDTTNNVTTARTNPWAEFRRRWNEGRQLADRHLGLSNIQGLTQGLNSYLNPVSWLPQFWNGMFDVGGNDRINPSSVVWKPVNRTATVDSNKTQTIQITNVTV